MIAHWDLTETPHEIPVGQTFLRDSGLTNGVFTVDAVPGQEETLKTAKNSPNEGIVQIKANQPNLFADCPRTATMSQPEDVSQEPLTKTRNRLESRPVEVFTDGTLTDPATWADSIQRILKGSRTRLVFAPLSKTWHDTSETSWYISTTVPEAETFCWGIRQHWGVENRHHHVRDVTMHEDASRIRINPTLVTRLRTLTLKILRVNKVTNICTELHENALKFERLFRYPELGLEH